MFRFMEIHRARPRPQTQARLTRPHLSCSQCQCSRMSPRGHTFVEVMITMVIVMITAIGTISAIVYSRINMELEKQRVTALNYCRQSMEAIQALDDAFASTKVLVPFNAPGVEDLNANVTIEYFKLNTNGTVDWNTSMTAASLDEPVFTRVSVAWVPYGSLTRPQEVSMSAVITRGID